MPTHRTSAIYENECTTTQNIHRPFLSDTNVLKNEIVGQVCPKNGTYLELLALFSRLLRPPPVGNAIEGTPHARTRPSLRRESPRYTLCKRMCGFTKVNTEFACFVKHCAQQWVGKRYERENTQCCTQVSIVASKVGVLTVLYQTANRQKIDTLLRSALRHECYLLELMEADAHMEHFAVGIWSTGTVWDLYFIWRAVKRYRGVVWLPPFFAEFETTYQNYVAPGLFWSNSHFWAGACQGGVQRENRDLESKQVPTIWIDSCGAHQGRSFGTT